MRVQYNPPVFPQYTAPRGMLVDCMECQALWYYYLLAKKQLELSEESIVLEGTVHYRPKYLNMFQGIITLYGVNPERVVKFWPYVDRQCEQMNMGKLPDRDEIRFNQIVRIQ